MRYLQTAILILILLNGAFGQSAKKNYFPVWTYHQDSINIHGVSLGLWSLNSNPRFTNTNGIKIELIGIGLFMPLLPRSPVVSSDSAFSRIEEEPFSETINGVNLSGTGSACNCQTNGITAGLVGQVHRQVNGLSSALVLNLAQRHNGIMMAAFNEAFRIGGLQLGITNEAYRAKGVQFGMMHNSAVVMKGLQVGGVNKSLNFKGVQIGLWNINQKRRLPILNWNFESTAHNSVEDELRIEDSLMQIRDSILDLKQAESLSLTSISLESGVWIPTGKLKRSFVANPNLALWVNRRLMGNFKNTYISLGLSGILPISDRSFSLVLPDTILVAKLDAPSGMIGLNVTQSIQLGNSISRFFFDLHAGVGYVFLKTDQLEPEKDSEGNPLNYYLYTFNCSGGASIRKVLNNNNSLALNTRYNYIVSGSALSKRSGFFGGESVVVCLEYRFGNF